MGSFFDSRKFLRTPGFVRDGLYADEEQALPPLPDRIARQDEQPSSIWGQMESAETAPINPIRELPPPQAPMRQMPPRERITVPEAPLPPKVGKMRQILGTAAELYLPQVGQEIRQPGYDRSSREYANKVAKLTLEAKLNETAAQEDSHLANSRASMARAEASNAARDRSRGQMKTDADFTLSEGQARYRHDGGSPIATHSKPPVPGIKIGLDGRPYHEPGAKFTELPPAVAQAAINTAPRANGAYNTLKQSIRDANPAWEDHQVDAEAAKQEAERRKLEGDVKKHNANRPYGKTGGGMTATGQAAETRRTVADLANEQVSKGGSVDKAIANMNSWPERDETAEKVLLHLHGLKSKELQKPGTKKASGLRGLQGGGAPTATPTQKPASTPAPKAASSPSSTPAIGTEKGGYRFKGGDPASPQSWEKM